ncbi:MAG: radical SAM family heme chaperone HemW [Desulfarculaceae bacterium]
MALEPDEELGLYVHLPFCPSRCPYCDFFAKVFNPREAALTWKSLFLHLDILSALAGRRTLDTVYLGGGTPSMWPAAKIEELLQAVQEHLGMAPGAEVTLEANPGTLSLKKLEVLVEAGVNRLSLGVQTFDPRLLKALGRRHGPEAVNKAVSWARQAGLGNLNLDLIYGLPGQTVAALKEDVKKALSLEPQHLSIYELTLSPSTPFGKQYRKNQPPLPSEESLSAMEEAFYKLVDEAGYKRYEVSNFATPGYECRHNQSTWRGGEYLALGPGAHGHLAGRRWSLTRDCLSYWQAVEAEEQPLEFSEQLSPEQQALEMIMLGLRTAEGVNWASLTRVLGQSPARFWEKALAQIQQLGWARLTDSYLVPTSKGLAMADAAAALFVP